MKSSLELAKYLDELLKPWEIEDPSLNGLQVANSGRLSRVGLAVDASLETFRQAREAGVDFLIVHHGLFWGKPTPITGSLYRRIRLLMEADIALYAAHLPLDLHPELGNNAVAMRRLGFENLEPFGLYRGKEIGFAFRLDAPMSRDALLRLLRERLEIPQPVLWPFGPEEIQRGAYVSGDGISTLSEAIDKGLDVLITGEPRHAAYWAAAEAGINVIFCGHYATERWGVWAVGEHLRERFNLPTRFIEAPTGL